MIADSSTAFLRRGIAPSPPLPAAAFRNVSPVQSNRLGWQTAWNSRNETIRCGRVVPPPRRSGSSSGGFPLPNPIPALKTLLCFTVGADGGAAPEEYLTAINRKKKEALQKLMGENFVEAEKIMRGMYEEYKRNKSLQIQYDATLALVEFLIHRGTEESWEKAVNHLDELEEMPKHENLPSDAKRPLYRAILLTLLDHPDDAKNSWSDYTSNIGSGPSGR